MSILSTGTGETWLLIETLASAFRTHPLDQLIWSGWLVIFPLSFSFFYSFLPPPPIQDCPNGLQEFILKLHQGDDMSHCLFLTNDLLWNTNCIGDLHISLLVHWEGNSNTHFNYHPFFLWAAPFISKSQDLPLCWRRKL